MMQFRDATERMEFRLHTDRMEFHDKREKMALTANIDPKALNPPMTKAELAAKNEYHA